MKAARLISYGDVDQFAIEEIPIAEVFPLEKIGAAQTASVSAHGKIVLRP